MVSKKRIYYGGLDRFQAPVVPKAPRSVRRRIHRKSSEGSEICAFELLAAVAGKLLQESESSTSSTAPEGKEQISIPKDSVKQEPLEVKSKHVRLEYLDQGSCAESEFVPEPTNLELKLEPPLKELPQSDNDSGLEHASVVTSDLLQKVGVDLKLETSEGKNGVNDDTPNNPEGGLPIHGDLCDVKLGISTAGLQTESVGKQSGDLTAVKTCSLGDTVTSCIHPHVLNKSYSSVHLPFYRDPVPSACFPGHRGNVETSIRDDDENSFSSNQHRSKMRAFRSQSRAGYRRMRKMLTSRYCKVAPKLKDYEISNTASGEVKPFYHDMKNNYMRERSASKRRKLFHHSLRTAYVEESISNLPEKSANGDQRNPPAASNRAAGVTSSVNNHKGSIQSKDSHVKLNIKSLKVPELYIEVPETATVGSLKRTVMEAITAILGSELHVGVLLQGKKVRDENRTLQQTGISENSDTLGFSLEPIFPQASPSSVQKEPPLSPPCDTHQHPSRSPADPFMAVCPNSSVDPVPATSLDHQVEKKQERVFLPTEASAEETVADARALVPVTAVNVEALSIVPLNHKPTNKRSELSQRRTRRPFSVLEVEALVEAVETLGTGRWRDVKIRAFDDANHRTYVDLKDKWKTLVHTASISPQQRRGEPVPQDLLDRVLAAHGYWSQHQPKPHIKHPIEPLQTLGTPVNRCLEFEP